MNMNALKSSLSVAAVLLALTLPLGAQAEIQLQTVMLEPTLMKPSGSMIAVPVGAPLVVSITNPTNQMVYFSVPAIGRRYAISATSRQTLALDFLASDEFQIVYEFSDAKGNRMASGMFDNDNYYSRTAAKLANIIHFNDKYQKTLGPEPRYRVQNLGYKTSEMKTITHR
jgi:hypothetical protein